MDRETGFNCGSCELSKECDMFLDLDGFLRELRLVLEEEWRLGHVVS